MSSSAAEDRNWRRNDFTYALALQFERWDIAIRECIRAIRRDPVNRDRWVMRLQGCMRLRHG